MVPAAGLSQVTVNWKFNGQATGVCAGSGASVLLIAILPDCAAQEPVGDTAALTMIEPSLPTGGFPGRASGLTSLIVKMQAPLPLKDCARGTIRAETLLIRVLLATSAGVGIVIGGRGDGSPGEAVCGGMYSTLYAGTLFRAR